MICVAWNELSFHGNVNIFKFVKFLTPSDGPRIICGFDSLCCYPLTAWSMISYQMFRYMKMLPKCSHRFIWSFPISNLLQSFWIHTKQELFAVEHRTHCTCSAIKIKSFFHDSWADDWMKSLNICILIFPSYDFFFFFYKNNLITWIRFNLIFFFSSFFHFFCFLFILCASYCVRMRMWFEEDFSSNMANG